MTSTSVLISDYFLIGNIGSALVNAALVLLLCLVIPYRLKMPINGVLMAALFTMTGFAFFGKNLLNIWFIILGVWLYAKQKRESFSAYVPAAYFATALSPLTSLIWFGLDLHWIIALPLSLITGLLTGWAFPPLAKYFMKFHQGYNLYNSGFTAGILGMGLMALLRAYNFNSTLLSGTLSGFNETFEIYLVTLFSVMFTLGLFHSKDRWDAFSRLHRESGISGSDFIRDYGLGIALMNMALMGFVATVYVVLIGGQLNGPSLGGILTVVGFGAYGKHVRNTVPILIGVFIAAVMKIWEPNSTSAILAALFGTTLAPIAGTFGPLFGVLAGFLHMAMVMSLGFLHGGINLYNNGFSGGFVAAIMVPLIEAHSKKRT